jgi:DNA-binding MarR family transcriptional regulator
MESAKFEFPQLIKDIVKGLDNDLRWKILEHLINNGSMSYSQLLKELNTRKGSLTFHLGALSKSAIIERYENLSDKTGNKSFYELSPIGKEVVNGLLSSLAPAPKPVAVFDMEAIKSSANLVSADIHYTKVRYHSHRYASAINPDNAQIEVEAVAS